MFSFIPDNWRHAWKFIQALERRVRNLELYQKNPVVRPAKLGRGGGGGAGIKDLRLTEDDVVQSTTKTNPAEEDWVDEFTLPEGGGGAEIGEGNLPVPSAAGQYLRVTSYASSSSYTIAWDYIRAR